MCRLGTLELLLLFVEFALPCVYLGCMCSQKFMAIMMSRVPRLPLTTAFRKEVRLIFKLYLLDHWYSMASPAACMTAQYREHLLRCDEFWDSCTRVHGYGMDGHVDLYLYTRGHEANAVFMAEPGILPCTAVLRGAIRARNIWHRDGSRAWQFFGKQATVSTVERPPFPERGGFRAVFAQNKEDLGQTSHHCHSELHADTAHSRILFVFTSPGRFLPFRKSRNCFQEDESIAP